MPPEPADKDTVSENMPPEPADKDTVSENMTPEPADKDTVSEMVPSQQGIGEFGLCGPTVVCFRRRPCS